jgi:hypothetical protein
MSTNSELTAQRDRAILIAEKLLPAALSWACEWTYGGESEEEKVMKELIALKQDIEQ